MARPDLFANPDFASNALRVANRAALDREIELIERLGNLVGREGVELYYRMGKINVKDFQSLSAPLRRTMAASGEPGD